MEQLSKQQLKNQIVMQTALHNNLKKWLSRAMIASTLFLSLALFFKTSAIVFWIALVLMSASVFAMLIIGLSLKRGKENLDKLFCLLDLSSKPVSKSS